MHVVKLHRMHVHVYHEVQDTAYSRKHSYTQSSMLIQMPRAEAVLETHLLFGSCSHACISTYASYKHRGGLHRWLCSIAYHCASYEAYMHVVMHVMHEHVHVVIHVVQHAVSHAAMKPLGG